MTQSDCASKRACRRMTPEDVLEVLREWHRQEWPDVEGTASMSLDFDTTVRDWWFFALMDDSRPAPNIGLRVNGIFGTDFSVNQWRGVVTPWKKKTLRDVCELVATRAEVAQIRPACVLGRECLPAGAFRAVKTRLASTGVDVAKLRPSSSLSDWLRKHYSELVLELAKLAPGRLPAMKVIHPARDRAECVSAIVYLAVLVCILSTYLIGPAALPVTGLVGLVASFARLWTSEKAEQTPDRIDCGELHDFRDLCYAIVGQTPTRRAATRVDASD